MHCVENLFCGVLGARARQFQEAKGPETENQLRTALVLFSSMSSVCQIATEYLDFGAVT
jgi:hypothetical protein